MEILLRLKDKVAIITGAGSGIGRESARLFAREGAKVVVVDVTEAAGRNTCELIGGAAIFVKADVSSWQQVEQMIRVTVDHFGQLDVLFNNAGIDLPQASNVVATSEADWDRIIEVNLKGVFLGSRHALPVMVAQRSGIIINTASRAGLAATPEEAAYCASKGGVVSLTRQMAVDYAPYNIRVNCICPGVMAKPTVDRQHYLQSQSSDAIDRRNKRFSQLNPLGRLCTPQDIAAAALYLASDESAYVTGTALLVDGGDLAI
jgi:NAD(P)-dependent dehydrogenase (short-subunit alcohol dehydrogenase family)